MGPRNTLGDLNNHLFEQLERLNDDELDLDTEMKRSDAVVKVSKQIIDNAEVVLRAQKHVDEHYGTRENSNMPRMLEGGD